MFDISFSEILVVFLISLIVIGPEKLPSVARKCGNIMANFRRYIHSIRQEIDKDLQLDELKNLKNNLCQQGQQVQQEFSNFANEIQTQIYQQQIQEMQHQSPIQTRPFDDFCGPMPKIQK